jgi:hypothetical protein
VGLGRFHPVRFEAALGQEVGHALHSGAGQQVGTAAEVAVGQKDRGTPDGSSRHRREI